MRIQKTFIEQIKDSSTPLNSPEPSQGILRLGRGGAAGKRGAIFSAGPAKGKVGREGYRERSWAHITRPLLRSFLLSSKLKVARQSNGTAIIVVPEGSSGQRGLMPGADKPTAPAGTLMQA